jgi:hypothetical protein
MSIPEMLLLFSTIERHKRDVRDLSAALRHLLDCLTEGAARGALYQARIAARSTCNRIAKAKP